MSIHKKAINKSIMTKLQDVLDPELYISIVDLGLIYSVIEKNGNVDIKMTLTTMGCPLFSVLEQDIKDKVLQVKGITDVSVNLVFDPPWTMDRLTERAKAMMGI